MDNLLDFYENNTPLPKRSDLNRKNEKSIRITYTRSYDYTIFVGYSDGKILKYYLQTPLRSEEFEGSHDGEVTSIVWDKDSDMLFTSGMDGKILIFSKKKCIDENHPEENVKNPITCMERVKNEDNLLLATSYEVLYIRDESIGDKIFIKTNREHHKNSFIVSLTYISSKKLVITGDTYGNICFWKIDYDNNNEIFIDFHKRIVKQSEYIVQTIYLETRDILLVNSRVSHNHTAITEYYKFDVNNNKNVSLESNSLNWVDVDRTYICNYILSGEIENQFIYCFAEFEKGEGGKIVFYELTDE